MTDIYVANHSQLMAALSNASGGETIHLKNGNYGSLDISGQSFSQYVTLVSENPKGAKFTDIDIENSSHIRIDGVHVNNGTNGGAGSTLVAVTNGSHDIQFVNSEVNGKVDGTYNGHFGLYTKDVSNVVFDNNYVHDVKRGGVFYSADGLEVSNNKIEHIGDDSFKFIGVHDVLIENNIGARFVHPEPGAHLDFIQFQGTDSSDIVVRGNVSLPQNNGSVQGIFFDDAHYTNVLIEQNIIYTGMIRGVSVSSGTNVVARYNTVLDVNGVASKATKVMVDGSSYGNIQGSYSADAGVDSRGNLTLQQSDPNGPYYYGDLFVNATAGLGVTLEDLRPIVGSEVENYGAYARLVELLDGTPPPSSQTPPAPQPEPTPQPEPEPQPEPTPEPEPTTPPETGSPSTPQSGHIEGSLFHLDGAHEFSSASDVIEVPNSPSLRIPAGTMALTFNADTVSGSHGLLSKDASHFTGGGHHFTSYIKNGTLYVRFQDGDSSQVFKSGGIKAGVDYDLQATFGNGTVSAWLDGESIGSARFDMNWENNSEHLQIGANGWASKAGQAGFTHVFDGTISKVAIVPGVYSPTELSALRDDSVPPAAPSDQPDTSPELPADVQMNLVYSLLDDTEFSGSKSDVVNTAHDSSLAIDEGTILFSFEADDVSGKSGLVSKDAYHYEGGGNHFSSWLNNGKLHVRFQDENSQKKIVVDNIEANKKYDLQAYFDDDEVGLLVNGELVGTREFTMDWGSNEEYLQVGGLGWASDAGEGTYKHAFDGTISDVAIYDEAVSQDFNYFG